MSEVTTIGLDIAKNVFHAHGADASGLALFSRKISRTKLLELYAKQPPCLVALKACGGAHHWARELTRLGHQVKLIPPAYVEPFLKRNKNDAVDADAICEAAQRAQRAVCGNYEARSSRPQPDIPNPRSDGAAADPVDQCDPRSPDRVWMGRTQGTVAHSCAR